MVQHQGDISKITDGLKKYNTILCDPAWPEQGGGKIKRGADRHYPLMKISEIKALPVCDLVGDNAHLYLWTTNNYLADAIECVKEWGFRYKTLVTWVKADALEVEAIAVDLSEQLCVSPDRLLKAFKNVGLKNVVYVLQNAGLGQYFRGLTEQVIFGVKGCLPYKINDGKRAQGRTVFLAPRTQHSVKPFSFYDVVERVSHPPYIELFARGKREGWDTWGNHPTWDVSADIIEIGSIRPSDEIAALEEAYMTIGAHVMTLLDALGAK